MTKAKKRILVGGGAGYIGSVLVPALIEAGNEVEVIDLLWFGNYLPKTVKVTKKDLFDCTEDDFAGFDEFIFLAGLSNDPMAEYSPSKNFIMNGALPSYLAYLAKRAGVKRFIYASSCSVYGFTVGKIFNEQSPASSDYPYGISKLQGEKGVLQLQDEKFSVIILRQGTVCGYSPKMRMDLIINAMFKSALTDRKITVNNPNIWRPIYDIRDCIQAFLLALRAPLALNGVFNVAAGNFTVLQVGKAVQHTLKSLGENGIDLEIKHLPDKRNYKVSVKKAKIKLKFQPKYFLSDIVKSIYERKDALGDLNQAGYYNIRVFKEMAQKEEAHRQKMAQIDKFKY
jgi:nucleoside-diphosphate-sugar epimerase